MRKRYRVVPYTVQSGAYGAESTNVPLTKISATLRAMQESQSEQITFAVIYLDDDTAKAIDLVSPIGVAILVGRRTWSVRLAECV